MACLAVAAFASFGASPARADEIESVDFSSQVRPILSDRCFHCHGPDADNQDSEFRLDSQENLIADLGGYAGVVPGDLEASELIARIRSEDEADMMPPPDSNRSLSEEEKRILEQWVAQGAPYEGHWAFEPPTRPEVPTEAVAKSGWSQDVIDRWSKNPIDAFLAEKLLSNQLTPSRDADPAIRLRRVALTLTGQLPSPELQDEYLADPSEQAFEKAVRELMSTWNYAERQALLWMDAARYADTDGYQNDPERSNWPWRDWVIQAFHDNMPFDQFTVEQLAGDMLPNATDNQRLATTFNRNHRQNSEGGALAEEFLVENVIDRVETTGTVWLGLTLGCTRCHDHKYDPITQREFYQFYGYFNNIGERGIGKGVSANPTMKFASPLATASPKELAAVQRAEQAIQDAEVGIHQRMNQWADETQRLLQTSIDVKWQNVTLDKVQLTGDGKLEKESEHTVVFQPTEGQDAKDVAYELVIDDDVSGTSLFKLTALPDKRFGAPRKLAPSVNGNFVLTDVEIHVGDQSQTVQSVSASFEQPNYPASNAIDEDPKSGWAVFEPNAKDESVDITFRLRNPIPAAAGQPTKLILRFNSPFANHVIGKLQVERSESVAELPQQVAELSQKLKDILLKTAEDRTKADHNQLLAHYRKIDQPLKAAQQQFSAAEKALILKTGPRVPVMVMKEREGNPQPAYLLDRGQYDQPVKDDPLPRGVPAALLSSSDASQPQDRLELARWMVSRENPLTARVAVNRIWQSHFGTGIVKTAEDFGLQSEMPSHRALLDWLAVEFIESGWDVQAMHRLIVTSAAFNQSSKRKNGHNDPDPGNRLISRGPRYRADGFVIRDLALQVAGIANDKVGGPSVKPYQPSGLWESVAARAGTRYKPDQGDSLYRKSMYSYWKRAVNPPRQTIFDASGREVCNVRVRRTNTPLQALVLMNDPTFVEAARNLAQRALQLDATDDERLSQLAFWAIAKRPSPSTLKVMSSNLSYFQDHYQAAPEAAQKLLAVGESKPDSQLDAQELAAMTAVAHLILNTDEFITVE
ncbi:PSD1 and planctomycete cytochrome C domain-containing protein [Rhodopirellula sp. P2]|uniref:PSD1 and planctomycete cytochrome C domain-containing protein n=1 Tax=Rhodopirellula sp. P2 TaxID=2127060 RepID=UPI00236854A2|nr:PSD1 and planctomycete cytochrome C domain-containing protein [Rhodopirellula sp. P2]WDQ16007.1 PSD1 and planctomycete cytochrome C domain-containing protein [Rhodopirellula sp. P2]